MVGTFAAAASAPAAGVVPPRAGAAGFCVDVAGGAVGFSVVLGVVDVETQALHRTAAATSAIAGWQRTSAPVFTLIMQRILHPRARPP